MAMRLVSDRVASLGILYATCVAADPGTRAAGVFPEDTHPAIVYQITLTAKANTSSAAGLLEFLLSPHGRAIFAEHGFGVIDR